MAEAVIPTMPFDDVKQQGIVGHCLHDAHFFLKVRSGVRQADFTDVFLGRVYKAIGDFYDRFQRLPSNEEVQREHGFTHAEEGTRKQMLEQLRACTAARGHIGLDLLKSDVERWMKAKIALESVTKFARIYNMSAKDPSKLDESLSILPEAGARIEATTFDDGQGAAFASATERYDDAKLFRQSRRYLSYGVKFLDDALGGFTQNEVILIGARTGAGKTQLATAIALHNARAGRRVHFFALEAEQFEIENRLIYSQLAYSYFQDRHDQKLKAHISYDRWMKGDLEAELGPFEASATTNLKRSFATLNTYYRSSGTFDVDTLDQEVRAIQGASDLIIIDHIHYVDVDGENENVAYKKVIKTLRDAALRFSVPIIILAHLRKTQPFRDKAVVPSLDDFHGTSDLTKVSTTCLMLGRAERTMDTPAYTQPTYIRIGKHRSNGAATIYTAQANFDIRKNMYDDNYHLGMLEKGDTEWMPLPEDKYPHGYTRPQARAA